MTVVAAQARADHHHAAQGQGPAPLRREADHARQARRTCTRAGRRSRFLQDEPIVGKLFGPLAERYRQRHGGYTRVLKAGFRYGDNAPMAVIELVDRDPAAKGAEDKARHAAQHEAASGRRAAGKLRAACRWRDRQESARRSSPGAIPRSSSSGRGAGCLAQSRTRRRCLGACSRPVRRRRRSRAVPESSEQIQLSFAPVVRKAAPAVVNIYSRAGRHAPPPRRCSTTRSSAASSATTSRWAPRASGYRTRWARASSSRPTASSSPTTTWSPAPTRSPSCSPTGASSPPGCSGPTSTPTSPCCGRCRRREPAVLELRDSDDGRGRRPGAGDRQSVRRRPDRHQRHRLAPWRAPASASPI